MSKSIEIYFDLKLHQFENNEENVDFSKLIYLFRIGVFYLFFNNDAIKFSKLLNLQIVKYGNNAIDCGFPVSAIEKYSKLINNSGYNFRIVVLEDSKLTNNPYRVYKTNFLPIGNEEELLKNELNFVGEVANYDNRIQGMYIKNLHNNKLRDDTYANLSEFFNEEDIKDIKIQKSYCKYKWYSEIDDTTYSGDSYTRATDNILKFLDDNICTDGKIKELFLLNDKR